MIQSVIKKIITNMHMLNTLLVVGYHTLGFYSSNLRDSRVYFELGGWGLGSQASAGGGNMKGGLGESSHRKF